MKPANSFLIALALFTGIALTGPATADPSSQSSTKSVEWTYNQPTQSNTKAVEWTYNSGNKRAVKWTYQPQAQDRAVKWTYQPGTGGQKVNNGTPVQSSQQSQR